MITTVTLNVAIDKAYFVDNVQIGDVMRVKDCIYTAGGKGINVSKVIQIAGEDIMATGFIGGHAGSFVEEQLKEKGIKTKFTRVQGETRSCINVIEPSTGIQTEFLEPGFEVTSENIQSFMHTYEELVTQSKVITISGSVPKGVDYSLYPKLIRIAKENGKKVILDTSGELLKEGIHAKPTMIKPNITEMEMLLGTPLVTFDNVIEGAKQFHTDGIEFIVVSLGSDGALVVCSEGVYHAKPPKLEVINTVGCGDSMVAAFAISFARGYDIKNALQYAVSISAASALAMETGFYNQENMESIYPRVEVLKYS